MARQQTGSSSIIISFQPLKISKLMGFGRPIPSIIKIYNWFMGGTDSMDQRLSYYRPNVKTKSWVPKMLTHFLNISVVNAYILYKQYFNKPKKYSLLMFTRELIDNLAEPWILQFKAEESDSTSPNSKGWMSKSAWSTNWMMRLSGIHKCTIVMDSRIDVDGIERHQHRGKCHICRKNAGAYCSTCHVHLCITTDGITRTCFDAFHEDKDIMD